MSEENRHPKGTMIVMTKGNKTSRFDQDSAKVMARKGWKEVAVEKPKEAPAAPPVNTGEKK